MSDRINTFLAFAIAVCASVLGSTLMCRPTTAATHDQIVEMCRQAMRPQIHACAQAKGLMGNPDAVRAQCGIPLVRPCVMREEQKRAVGTPAPAAPKDDTASMPVDAAPLQPTFVAPPRTIADITAILDSEKPDKAKISKRQADAEAIPPSNVSASKLAQFYYDRGNARALLAHNKEALADGLQALAAAKGGVDHKQLVRIRQFIGLQYRAVGDPKNAIVVLDSIVREADQPGARGSLILALSNIAQTLVSMGDVTQAGTYAGRIEQRLEEARGSPNPNWRAAYSVYGRSWEGDGARVQGMVFESRGQYAEAEAAYRRAEAFKRAALKDIPKMDFPPPPEQMMQAVDIILLARARNEGRQQRLSEAEADTRRALLEVLKAQGKYAPTTPQFIVGLAAILVEQGRYQEAEKLGRSALDIQRTLGIRDDAPQSVAILSGLGNILVAERKAKDAAVVYAQLDKALEQWAPQQREAFELNNSRIAALYASGQLEAGIAAAETLVKRQMARTGANSFDTASAQGSLAIGYAGAGRDADAVREFKAAIPILMTAAGETDNNDPTLVAARNARLQRIIETYISVLARSRSISNDIAVETFGLADAIRGHAVERALADASARMVAKDPALAALVRREQDLAKQISAQLGALNNLYAMPSDQRDDQMARAINAAIEKMRVDRKAARQQINRQFPAYADLVDPKPPTVEEIRTALRPGEALLSYYFGQDASFVWAVPEHGAVAFAAISVDAAELATKVRKLRRSLEPQAEMVSDIPPFDLTLAYELYTLLLKPVETGW